MSLPVPDFSREPPWDPKPGPALKSTTIDEKINAMTLRNRPTSNRHRPTKTLLYFTWALVVPVAETSCRSLELR
jgi:hypothetical protein